MTPPSELHQHLAAYYSQTGRPSIDPQLLGFAIDASLVKVDANRRRGVPGGEADWSNRQSISRPVREYREI